MKSLNLNTEPLMRVLDILSTARLSLFLILCFVLGGSNQEVFPKLILYLTSLLLIGVCLSSLTKESNLWKMKSLIVILGSLFAAHILYLIPLPPSIWSGLPGRAFIENGFQTLGGELPWLPLSLAPERTFFSLFGFLPPFAVVVLMGTVVTAKEFRLAIWSLGALVIASAIMGILQVSSFNSEFYLYSFTNKGSAVGFFANANHYCVFLLMTMPIVMCLSDFSRRHKYEANRGTGFSIICIVSALLGVGMSGSLGGYLLILPTLIGTYFIWTSNIEKKSIYFIGIFGSLLLVFLFDAFLSGNLQKELLEKFTNVDASERQKMFGNSYDITKTFFPFGTGPGSFRDVYLRFEEVGSKTVPHAHNDYIEMLAEFGAIGFAWMVLGLSWVAKNIWTALTSSKSSNKIAKYFSLAIAIVLVHSVVDFSLRTISVMTLFVFSLCILSLSNHSDDIIEE